MASPATTPKIPAFTVAGLLPPYTGLNATDESGMSPYKCTILEFVQRYATTPERRNILNGLLSYRAALLGLGITGFQWLGGSFTERIEILESRAPNDVDVVTILRRPATIRTAADLATFATAAGPLFDTSYTKSTYRCDAYGLDLDAGSNQFIVDQARYWFGLFTHRRVSNVWKGIVEVPLISIRNPDEIASADFLKANP